MPRRKKRRKKKIIPMAKTPYSLRGMNDILPADEVYWEYVIRKGEKIAREYGFKKIETPILEKTALFVRSVGKDTDIVEKEMFTFTNQGEDEICLRPEATASMARAYIEHGMIELPQPVKLYHLGPIFRYSRPQAGRFREFHQFDFDVLGDPHPVIDAQLILIAYNFCQSLELKVNIQVNSIGCSLCRGDYKKALKKYLSSKKKSLCKVCKKRLLKNPLRILDCKEKSCQEVVSEAPQIVDWLCEDCKGHFVKVLEYLDELEVPYVLNPYLVRGLDYYNRTVFEIWLTSDERGENSLGGGGKYDDLVEVLGGKPTSACGFALGLERVISSFKEVAGVEKKISKEKPKIFLAQLGEIARRKSLVLFEDFRSKGIRAIETFSKDSLRTQLEIANKSGVKFTLILGQKEVIDGTIIIRDMESRIQEVINFEKVVPEIEKRLEEQ
ncbi:MAG: histidine--tRNA ligase [Parcubacteria group bacterium CG_4_10_14_0_8_um_filter_35_7]|nr:MAG: histidine--tRNA ligase [Parcubacteria group bacterium CG23_combo_of_CG06-09_8_20_14_all_35_9]PIY78630.1 MAG: histidine--tRNA ligase [Parcubacteria group bacterium CG_4_10_14_0_8_um_filter_35_7]